MNHCRPFHKEKIPRTSEARFKLHHEDHIMSNNELDGIYHGSTK